ncbi:MAG TPA: hypothetical protein VMV19_03545, partial [Xanthobacteraceae bacterium]|nr:hypothetical protein [Xanthobacteraceae bacterium]
MKATPFFERLCPAMTACRQAAVGKRSLDGQSDIASVRDPLLQPKVKGKRHDEIVCYCRNTDFAR